MDMSRTIKVFLLLAGSALASAAHATSLNFDCITLNNDGDCSIGEAQVTVDVLDIGNDMVRFTFNNSGPEASSIEGVYFDDGALLAIASITNGPGVDFTAGSASPPDLPGANNINPPFEVTAGFLADSDPPTAPNGVNPGEFLHVDFTLQNGLSYANVITDLATGDLRIGVRVISFDSGGSEAFVNNPVPVPAAVWLFGSGLLGLVSVARRKRV